ncbi:unnamed protein product [Larinioides sclopetarius]|uniref:Uncharacterized protein n=1 Tax=Larinioides sclopetarius TaxID=280406 RepID=A0AAV1ZZQ1_9ARAC
MPKVHLLGKNYNSSLLISHTSKPNTTEMKFLKFFYTRRQHYCEYTPIFTDGSKVDSHVDSAVVFSNFTISETFHPFCSVYTSELYAIYLGLLKISALNIEIQE